jgi:hypothetical protein
MITGGIAWIRPFHFDIVHVPGKQLNVADGLSRGKGSEEDIAEAEAEDMQEVLEFLDRQLVTFWVRTSGQVRASG